MLDIWARCLFANQVSDMSDMQLAHVTLNCAMISMAKLLAAAGCRSPFFQLLLECTCQNAAQGHVVDEFHVVELPGIAALGRRNQDQVVGVVGVW